MVNRFRPVPLAGQLSSGMRRLGTGAMMLCMVIGHAEAHAHLRSASPEPDSTVAHAPGSVTVTFTEKLEEKLSSLVVRDGSGHRVDKGDFHFATGSDRNTVLVTVGPLTPGPYTVDWTATSIDTHRTTGSFTFVIRP